MPVSTLLLMRHAKSDWAAGARDDFSRPLNDRGRKAADRIGTWLRDEALLPDAVVASAAVRTRRTAERVLAAAGYDAPLAVDLDLYGATASTWVDVLRSASAAIERLLIVGHNPTMSVLATSLCDAPIPPTSEGKVITTATLVQLEFARGWHSVAPSTGRFVRVVRPRELSAGA